MKTTRAKISRKDLLRMGMTGSALAMAGSMIATCTGRDVAEAATDAANALGEGKTLKGAMSNGGLLVDWFAQGKDTATWWCKALNMDLTWYDGQLDPVKQRTAIESMANKQWNWVAITPQQAGTLVDPVQRIIATGTPVMQMISQIGGPNDKLDLTTWVEQSSFDMGFAVTTALAKAIGEKGTIIQTQGPSGFTGAQERARGFRAALKNFPNIKVLADDFADWDPSKAQTLWRAYLNKYPSGKISAGYFQNDQMALAAQQIILQAGRASEIKIGGADGMPPAIEAVRKGTMVATVRHSSSRMHQLPVLIGFLLGHNLLTRDQIPKHLRIDGPVVTHDDRLVQDSVLFFEKINWA